MATLIVTFAAGVAIALQAALNDQSGRVVGAVPTGMLVNMAGGAIGLVILSLLIGVGQVSGTDLREAAPYYVGAGLLGLFIVSSVAFALPRTGIVAGIAAILLGQLAAATLIDTFGWGAIDAIPLKPERLFGLALLLVSVFVLLPRED